MVRSLLDGSKTQTRRAWRDQPPAGVRVGFVPGESTTPYGQPGDQLWVREAWRAVPALDPLAPRDLESDNIIWLEASRAQWENLGHRPGKLRPGMFMCRWMSRIQLEITGVRVERLQDISEADALAEGVDMGQMITMPMSPSLPVAVSLKPRSAVEAYAALWETINGPGSWELNPYVWVIEFKRLMP